MAMRANKAKIKGDDISDEDAEIIFMDSDEDENEPQSPIKSNNTSNPKDEPKEAPKQQEEVKQAPNEAPIANVQCFCGHNLIKVNDASSLYDGNGCYCDQCGRLPELNETVWHCQQKDHIMHPQGFDICDKCLNDIVSKVPISETPNTSNPAADEVKYDMNETKVETDSETSNESEIQRNDSCGDLSNIGCSDKAPINAPMIHGEDLNEQKAKPQPKHTHVCNGHINTCSYLFELTNMLKSYDEDSPEQYRQVTQILDDYHHLSSTHDSDPDFAIIYKAFGGKCNVETCTHYTRSYRERTDHIIIDDNITSKDIACLQITDMIHCYYLHSYDIGHRLTLLEISKITADKAHDSLLSNHALKSLNDTLSEKHKLYRSHRGVQHNKFLTNNEDTEDNKEDDESDDVYSWGVEFKYDGQKNYDSQFLKNERFWNKAIPQPITVENKYNSLKEEVTASYLNNEQWNTTYILAQKHLNSYHFNHELFRSSDNRPDLEHLLAIMLRCNFDDLQHDFNKTYRRLSKTETDESISKRHGCYYWFGKYLKEAINEYGKDSNGNGPYYHGISKKLLFRTLRGCGISHGIMIWSPLSTTDQRAVAMNFAMDQGGIILEFQSHSYAEKGWGFPALGGFVKRTQDAKCFSVKWLSRFPSENESLFAQSIHCISIINIECIAGNIVSEYKLILKALKLISDLSEVEPVVDEFNKGIIKLATFIVHHQLSKRLPLEYKAFTSLDEYGRQLIDIYCRYSVKKVFLSWRGVFEDAENVKYLDVMSPFCKRDIKWIDLRKLNMVFPQLCELHVVGVTVTKEILEDILEYLDEAESSLQVILLDERNPEPFITAYESEFGRLGFRIQKWYTYLCIDRKEKSSKLYDVYDK